MYLSQCSSVWQRSWSTGTRHPPPQGTQWSARTQWDVVVGWEFFFFCCCMQINVKKEEELRNGTLACLNIIAGYESHSEVILTVVLSKASKQVHCSSYYQASKLSYLQPVVKMKGDRVWWFADEKLVDWQMARSDFIALVRDGDDGDLKVI